MNFRCHIALSSKLSSELATSVTALSRGGKSKVSNLDVEVLRDEQVLRL